jgi:hypothetical protein
MVRKHAASSTCVSCEWEVVALTRGHDHVLKLRLPPLVAQPTQHSKLVQQNSAATVGKAACHRSSRPFPKPETISLTLAHPQRPSSRPTPTAGPHTRGAAPRSSAARGCSVEGSVTGGLEGGQEGKTHCSGCQGALLPQREGGKAGAARLSHTFSAHTSPALCCLRALRPPASRRMPSSP